MGLGKKNKEPLLYERLIDHTTNEEQQSPKGHVPVLVGRETNLIEKIFVNVKLFNNPHMVALLEMSADELGDNTEGILRITCDVEHFCRVVSVISRAR